MHVECSLEKAYKTLLVENDHFHTKLEPNEQSTGYPLLLL